MGTKPTIGDDAVRSRTGKDWNGWFRILDRVGAERMKTYWKRNLDNLKGLLES